jgi:hypothetical protein
MSTGFANFKKKITNPIAYRAFLLAKLPLVYFTGIKVESLNEQQSITSVSYSWLNQNPFRSIYFAVMNMAAELSTGVLCMGNIYQQPISMLIVKSEAVYQKKAVGKIRFVCNDGNAVAATVEAAKTTGEAQSIRCYSVAENKDGEIVAEFWFTWSLKKRSTR